MPAGYDNTLYLLCFGVGVKLFSPMLETPHVALGVAIATKFPNPFIAIPLSFASHFILDRVPHWNPHLYTETQKTGHPSLKSTIIGGTDIGIALIFGSFFAYKALPNTNLAILILASSFASVLSDVIKYPYYYFNFRPLWLKKWVDFERAMQVNSRSVFWGLVTQLIMIFASLLWLRS